MPFPNVEQPEIIMLSDTVRLRKYDGNYEIGLPWYQDPEVFPNSEGILDDRKVLDLKYVQEMYEWLDENGELYFIEVRENDVFISIGDITIKPENPPIAIGGDRYRGKGMGTLVMKAVIERLKNVRI